MPIEENDLLITHLATAGWWFLSVYDRVCLIMKVPADKREELLHTVLRRIEERMRRRGVLQS